ncbi:MAG: hypothetical protein Q8Q42_01190 [Nanoarchaeota archaeon]|nr:hypothetical protein [Nanoarchaeota archaeon]
MKMAYLLVLILLSSSVYGAPERSVTLLDSGGEVIREVVVHLTYFGEVSRMVLSRDGMLNLDESLLNKPVRILLDKSRTDGMDYYFNGVLEDNAVLFTPISQIRGDVHDELDNLVGNANLGFDCDHISSIKFPEKTDRYGSFSSYLPTGKCVISATDGKLIGRVDIENMIGDSKVVNLVLDKQVSSSFNPYYLLIFVVVFLLLVYMLNKPRIKNKSTRKKENKKLGAIVKTLNDTEKSIVDYIVANGNKTTSSDIRHSLGIPKTTLSRVLDRMESKKMIEMEREGKLKKIKLSDWLK